VKPEGHEDVIHKIDRIFDKIVHISTRALISVSVVVLVASILLIGIYILGRAAFNIPWLFVEEFTGYALVLLTFFALAYTLRTEGHITIDFVVRRFPKRVQSILKVVTDCLALVLVAYLTMRGVEWFWYGVVDKVHSPHPSHVIMWPYYMLVPIGLAILDLALLHRVYHRVVGLVKGESIEE
jgi:TRAP-type C4-dicarboxylate transport system permease small subunit